MRNLCLAIVGTLLLAACGRTVTVTELSIVPEPVFTLKKDGYYPLTSNVAVAFYGLGQNSATAKYIMNSLRHAHLHPSLVARSEESDLEFILNDTVNTELGDEGYLLEVRSSGVRLSANTERGLFYAYQTLIQIIPPDVLDHSYNSIILPEFTVLDYPRFEWRGVTVDGCHHFFKVKDIKKMLDIMANYKMNRFGWQLVDCHAWRLPSNRPTTPTDTTARPDNDHYTREQIAEVVEYATSLGIEVVPAVELCFSGDTADRLVHATLDEIMELFPSRYVQLGAEGEASDGNQWSVTTGRWTAGKSLLATAVQYLQEHKRTPIGWDKTQANLGPDALVTACSLAAGQEAARNGRKVIMSPDEFCRLDVYQADPRYQPKASDGLITLASAYRFDPAPQGTNVYVARSILGGQCRLGTRHITRSADAEYLLLPRLLALSESLWSPVEAKDWNRFRKYVEIEKVRLESKGYTYCEGSFTPLFRATRVDDRTTNIAIETEVPNTYIFFTTDTTAPTRQSPIYLGPFNLQRGTHIKILPVYKDLERDSVYEFVIK